MGRSARHFCRVGDHHRIGGVQLPAADCGQKVNFRLRSGPLQHSQSCHGTRDRDHQARPDLVVPAKPLSDSWKALFEIVDHLPEIRPGNLNNFNASCEFKH
jgi:hypothetical protein